MLKLNCDETSNMEAEKSNDKTKVETASFITHEGNIVLPKSLK